MRPAEVLVVAKPLFDLVAHGMGRMVNPAWVGDAFKRCAWYEAMPQAAQEEFRWTVASRVRSEEFPKEVGTHWFTHWVHTRLLETSLGT